MSGGLQWLALGHPLADARRAPERNLLSRRDHDRYLAERPGLVRTGRHPSASHASSDFNDHVVSLPKRVG